METMRPPKTEITDFSFEFKGYGAYKVTYTSPVTGEEFSSTTSDMMLIDLTKNADEPKRVDLNALKALCKG